MRLVLLTCDLPLDAGLVFRAGPSPLLMFHPRTFW